eukprot:TRINITY_DN74913_c0_g1_i1.p2 TRINITY_DN74913_c0_g1~~TRINITY_DN74913_c0_g1_i1.p2  ORF type:complete len:113 (-),score=0.88 TRINITY_DN74913_c0_g1_i1:178-516(-)
MFKLVTEINYENYVQGQTEINCANFVQGQTMLIFAKKRKTENSSYGKQSQIFLYKSLVKRKKYNLIYHTEDNNLVKYNKKICQNQATSNICKIFNYTLFPITWNPLLRYFQE